MNKLMKFLLPTAIAVASMTACTPHAGTGACLALPTPPPRTADYIGGNPGKWVRYSDGKVIGYAQEEDSNIYLTAACALDLG